MQIFLTILLAIGFIAGCATSKKSGSSGGGDGFSSGKRSGGVGVDSSRNRAHLTHTLNNSNLTSKNISKSKAERAISSFRGKKLSINEMETLLSIQRIGGAGLSNVLKTAISIAREEVKKNIRAEPSDFVKLELGLAALQSRNYAMSEFFLYPLLKSKVGKVKAGASNALGIIALFDGRIPEAVQLWKQALVASPNYEAATLNLGFIALKHGDVRTAGRYLSSAPDWYTKSGMLVVSRFMGRENQSKKFCDEVLSKRPSHKMTLFNCGIFELQNKKNFDKARKLITKAVKERGGDPRWEENGYRILSKIDSLQYEQRKKAAQQKALQQKAKPKKPAPKPKSDPKAPAK